MIFKKSYPLQNSMQCYAVWGREQLSRPRAGDPVSPDGRRACIVLVSKVCPWSKKMLNEIAALRDFRTHTCFSSFTNDKKAQASGESWAWRAEVLSEPSGQWDSELGPFSLVWARDYLGTPCWPLACPGSSNHSAGFSAGPGDTRCARVEMPIALSIHSAHQRYPSSLGVVRGTDSTLSGLVSIYRLCLHLPKARARQPDHLDHLQSFHTSTWSHPRILT